MASEVARALRRNRTSAERRSWSKLRGLKQLSFRLRQQAPIGPFVVDFVCLSRRLVIEVDGGMHSKLGERQADQRRTRWLNDRGYEVLRISNSAVYEDINAALDVIIGTFEARPDHHAARQGPGLLEAAARRGES